MSLSRSRIRQLGASLGLALMVSGCSGSGNDPTPQPEVDITAKTDFTIEVSSSGFSDGRRIPLSFSCDGALPGGGVQRTLLDQSPPLKWGPVPDGTKSVAIIVDDPDAKGGTFVHWVVYAIPPDVSEFPKGLPSTELLPSGVKQGINDADQIGYSGPCPPSGTHRYFFKVYALDMNVGLAPGMTKAALLDAVQGNVLAMGQLTGTYGRR